MDYSILLGYHWRDKEGGPNQKLELHAQLKKAKHNKKSGLRKIGSDMFSPSGSRSGSRRNSENNTNSASTPIAVVREKEKEKEKENVYSVGEGETPVLGTPAGLSPLPEDLETGDGDAGHIFSECKSHFTFFFFCLFCYSLLKPFFLFC